MKTRTAIAVAATLVAAAALSAVFSGSVFENRKIPTTVYAHETGEGYCVMDNAAARGDVAVLSDAVSGDCHAETVGTAIHAKQKKIIIGIVEHPCARGQPCLLVMLGSAQIIRPRPTATLRE